MTRVMGHQQRHPHWKLTVVDVPAQHQPCDTTVSPITIGLHVAPEVGQTLFTQVGAFLGTPGYMSPEQADPELHDVDTRTDVYSLGSNSCSIYDPRTVTIPY